MPAHIFRMAGFIVAAVLCGHLNAQEVTPTTPAATVEQRIAQFEQGLIEQFLIEGEPVRRTPLLQRMAELKVPGVSIAVIHNGKIDWAKGYGVTKAGGAPVTDRTLFQAGSISKSFAAVAVLRLLAENKIDLDTDVNRYLKSWKVPENQFTRRQKVTLRRLLSHTSGLAAPPMPLYSAADKIPTLVQFFKGEPPAYYALPLEVEAIPGSRYLYSNAGYALAQLVLENVTQRPFSDLLQQWVLGPIGMTDSTFEQPLSEELVGASAAPHESNGLPTLRGPEVIFAQAAGGLWSTPSDLARYAIELQQSLAGKSKRVITTSNLETMLTPITRGYGLGMTHWVVNQPGAFGHDGGTFGYLARLWALDSGDGVVIMVNATGGGGANQLIAEIQSTFSEIYAWPKETKTKLASIMAQKIDPKKVASLEGRYFLPPYRVFTISAESGRPFAQASQDAKHELLETADGRYVSKALFNYLPFSIDDKSRPQRLIFNYFGRRSTALRIDDTRADQVIADINNRFRFQKPIPTGEAAIDRLLTEIRLGEFNTDLLAPDLAQGVKHDVQMGIAELEKSGPLISVKYKLTRSDGSEIYDVRFANRRVDMFLVQGLDGKIYDFGF
jgi:CubicO group peptidase (beta-lactamase class C family)